LLRKIFSPLGIAQMSLALLSLVEKIDEFNALVLVYGAKSIFKFSNFQISTELFSNFVQIYRFYVVFASFLSIKCAF